MSLQNELKTLCEERKKVLDQAGVILAKAGEEKRDLTSEERQEFEARHADGDKAWDRIQMLQKQLDAESHMSDFRDDGRISGREDRHAPPIDGETINRATDFDAAMRTYISRGLNSMTNEERAALGDFRAQSQGTTTAGGYLVPANTSFYSRIDKATKELGLDESLFTVINTDDTGDLPIPTNDDTAQSGSSMMENADAGTATDYTFGQSTLYAYINTTGVLKVSNKLLTGPTVAEQFLADGLGERVARRRGAQLTTGTGSAGQTSGIVTGSTKGRDAASATAISPTDILELVHSVDVSYRRNARFMMHDSVHKAIKLLVDSQGRPLYQASFAGSAPGTFDGYPIVVNNNMDSTLASTKKSVLFGDLKKFVVRNAGGLIFRRLEERFAEYYQTGFVAFWMFDSKLINTAAVKHILH